MSYSRPSKMEKPTPRMKELVDHTKDATIKEEPAPRTEELVQNREEKNPIQRMK
jgi:hypothetical protein